MDGERSRVQGRAPAGHRRRIATLTASLLLAGPLVASGPAVAVEDVKTERIAGADRYQTAARAATGGFTSATHAIVATGEAFPDGLAGAALAGASAGPLLLVRPTSVPSDTSTALRSLGVTKVTILGGAAAVSQAVENELKQSYTVNRVSGDNRYATAASVARAIGSSRVGTLDDKRAAFLATGENFADALAAGPLAFGRVLPILLTRSTSLPAETADAIRDLGIKHVVILGGSAAVSSGVETSVKALGASTERVQGTDRAGTAAALATRALAAPFSFDGSKVLLSRGDAFPDALAGGPHGGQVEAPILLTSSPTVLGTASEKWLTDNNSTVALIRALGGAAAISNAVLASAERAAETDGDEAPAGTHSGEVIETGAGSYRLDVNGDGKADFTFFHDANDTFSYRDVSSTSQPTTLSETQFVSYLTARAGTDSGDLIAVTYAPEEGATSKHELVEDTPAPVQNVAVALADAPSTEGDPDSDQDDVHLTFDPVANPAVEGYAVQRFVQDKDGARTQPSTVDCDRVSPASTNVPQGTTRRSCYDVDAFNGLSSSHTVHYIIRAVDTNDASPPNHNGPAVTSAGISSTGGTTTSPSTDAAPPRANSTTYTSNDEPLPPKVLSVSDSFRIRFNENIGVPAANATLTLLDSTETVVRLVNGSPATGGNADFTRTPTGELEVLVHSAPTVLHNPTSDSLGRVLEAPFLVTNATGIADAAGNPWTPGDGDMPSAPTTYSTSIPGNEPSGGRILGGTATTETAFDEPDLDSVGLGENHDNDDLLEPGESLVLTFASNIASSSPTLKVVDLDGTSVTLTNSTGSGTRSLVFPIPSGTTGLGVSVFVTEVTGIFGPFGATNGQAHVPWRPAGERPSDLFSGVDVDYILAVAEQSTFTVKFNKGVSVTSIRPSDFIACRRNAGACDPSFTVVSAVRDTADRVVVGVSQPLRSGDEVGVKAAQIDSSEGTSGPPVDRTTTVS